MLGRFARFGLLLALAACDRAPREEPPVCVPPTMTCGALCVDTSITREHCGACGNACTGWDQCIEGRCRLACGMDQIPCGNACVALYTDARNCGACGNACDAGQRCIDGRCLERCGERAACVPEQRCEAGACVDRCAPGYRWCDGQCVDPLSSVEHCGGCGGRCRPGVGLPNVECNIGVCTACPAGRATCATLGICGTDLGSPEHCGACGHRCAGEETCLGSECFPCPAGTARCGSSRCEVHLLVDYTNCGACGHRCTGDERCVNGVCTPPPPPPPCREGFQTCELAHCGTDVTRDPMNCGACRRRCPSDTGARATCERGACGLSCEQGRADCDGAPGCETELDLDAAHCGACGHACGDAEQCRAGTCVARPVAPVRPMSGARVATRTPRFAWRLGRGRDGALLEVCATRACGEVLRAARVAGTAHVFAEPFAPGLYYWRLRALRGGALEATTSATWAFVVHEIDGPLTPEHVAANFYGDGSDFIPGVALPENRACMGVLRGVRWGDVSIVPVGDEDGDGYGDARIVYRYSWVGCPYGGGRGILAERALGGAAGLRRAESVYVNEISFELSFGVMTIEDFDGDGLADHVLALGIGNGLYARLALGWAQDEQSWMVIGWPSDGGGRQYFAAGDLDGDLASEIASNRVSSTSTVLHLVGRRVERVQVPRCDALGAAIPNPLDVVEDLRPLPDLDRDGYIDVQSPARRADGSIIQVLWRGGPGGARADRCALAQ